MVQAESTAGEKARAGERPLGLGGRGRSANTLGSALTLECPGEAQGAMGHQE